MEPNAVGQTVRNKPGRKPGKKIAVTQKQAMLAQALLSTSTQREAANRVGMTESYVSALRKDPQFSAYLEALKRGNGDQGDKARNLADKSLSLADRNLDQLHEADPVTGMQGAALAIRVAREHSESFSTSQVKATPTKRLLEAAARALDCYRAGILRALNSRQSLDATLTDLADKADELRLRAIRLK